MFKLLNTTTEDMMRDQWSDISWDELCVFKELN